MTLNRSTRTNVTLPGSQPFLEELLYTDHTLQLLFPTIQEIVELLIGVVTVCAGLNTVQERLL